MEFDGFVEGFVSEHILFTEALKGIFLASVMSGKSPSDLTDLEARAYRAAKTYYTRATRELDSFTADLLLDDGSEQLEASLRHRNANVLLAVRLAVLGSIKTIVKGASDNALGSPPQNITQTADFVKGPDGRNWRAEKLVRTIVRDFAYQSHTDKAIDTIMLNGGKEVVIKYDVPGDREYEDAVLTIEDFAALRSTIFHINASARVSDHV